MNFKKSNFKQNFVIKYRYLNFVIFRSFKRKFLFDIKSSLLPVPPRLYLSDYSLNNISHQHSHPHEYAKPLLPLELFMNYINMLEGRNSSLQLNL